MVPAARPIHVDKGEIYDATFSSKTVCLVSSFFDHALIVLQLVVATTVNMLVYALPSDEDSDNSEERKEGQPVALELLRTIDRPDLPGKDAGSSFRAAR